MGYYLPKKVSVYAGVITPNLNSASLYACTKVMEDFYPGLGFSNLISIYTKQGEESYWIEDDDWVIPKFHYLLENPRILEDAYATWQKEEKRFYAHIDELSKRGIKNIVPDYKAFLKAYIDEYAAALLTEYFYLGSEWAFQESLKRYPHLKKQLEEAVHPLKQSFTMENEYGLLKIALLPKSKQAAALKRHQKDFFWLHNSYKYTPIIPISFFKKEVAVMQKRGEAYARDRIKAMLSYAKDQHKRLDALRDLVDPRTFSDIYWVSKLSHWMDRRKRANLIANYWMNEFLKAAAKELPYSFEELQFALYTEVIGLLEGLIKDIPAKERMKGCVHLAYSDGTVHLVHGPESEELKSHLLGLQNLSQKDIRGTAVSRGVVRGIARVIKSPKEPITKGEILVTSMTRPDFMPLITKAAAIVTDEGGITCHAAIVSRELGLPCIVGTRNATKVLKTGMKIEVNCNHGVVRILGKRSNSR